MSDTKETTETTTTITDTSSSSSSNTDNKPTSDVDQYEITPEMIKQQQSAYATNNNNNKNKNKKNNNRNNKNNNKNKNYNKDDKQQGEKRKQHDEESVTEVVVSGLPLDGSLKEEDLQQTFKKAGYILSNSFGRPMISLYHDPETKQFNGSAIITYERKESIPLAVLQFDQIELVPNHTILVRKATLEESIHNQENIQTSFNSKKGKQNQKDKRKEHEEELKYGWADSESKTVVIKNLFEPQQSWSDPDFFNRLQEDLEDVEFGCGKCGEISSMVIFHYNPDGVAVVKFKDFESAERCVALMNGRYFDKRRLVADLYDGFTDYHVEESDQDKEKRMALWQKWLDKEEGDSNQETTTETTETTETTTTEDNE